jgi:hypothetical protein
MKLLNDECVHVSNRGAFATTIVAGPLPLTDSLNADDAIALELEAPSCGVPA